MGGFIGGWKPKGGSGGFQLVPFAFGFSSMPPAIVKQEFNFDLVYSGTRPAKLLLVVPPELASTARLTDLSSGVTRLSYIPPEEGNTVDVTKQIEFIGWNAHPSTDEDSPVSLTIAHTVRTTAVNAGWGITAATIPDQEVGVAVDVKFVDLVGDAPYVIDVDASSTLTLAKIRQAGLDLNSSSFLDAAVTTVISGTPIVGSENTLGQSLTLRLRGKTGVAATKTFATGIPIKRLPGINLVVIPTFTSNTNFSLAQYLYGYPAPNIAVKSGYFLPAKFALTSGVLIPTGLTSGDNGTSNDIVFQITNGYHAAQEFTSKISVAIQAAVNACPGAIFSVSKNAKADGVVMSSLTNGYEIQRWLDIASEILALSKAEGTTSVPHIGGIYDATAKCVKITNGTGEAQRSSMGLEYSTQLGAKWLLLRIRMPSAQIPGESNVMVLGPSWIGFTKGASAGQDLFKFHTGNAVLSSPQLTAIDNFLDLLIYIVDTDTAGICWGTAASAGTIAGDTGPVSVPGIDGLWQRFMFSPGYMQAADSDIQCFAFGFGVLT